MPIYELPLVSRGKILKSNFIGVAAWPVGNFEKKFMIPPDFCSFWTSVYLESTFLIEDFASSTFYFLLGVRPSRPAYYFSNSSIWSIMFVAARFCSIYTTLSLWFLASVTFVFSIFGIEAFFSFSF